MTGKKVLCSLFWGILLCMLYMTIFSFSAQEGETSSGLSKKVSEKCVDLLDNVSGSKMSKQEKDKLVTNMEHPIRKLAHFSEYACMGILVFGMLSPWIGKRKKLAGITVLWVFLSAIGDEIHQLYVPGRDGNFLDVLIDTSGGAFGILISLATVAAAGKAADRRRHRKTVQRSED